MAGKPPYFPFYAKDFTADGKVEAMSTEEVGAYILLLCKAWEEEPPGSIPDNDRVLARWARVSSERWSEMKSSVLAPFTLGSDGRWYQKRMCEEFAHFRKISRSRRQAAESRWGAKKENEGEPENANGMQMHSKEDAKEYKVSGSISESSSLRGIEGGAGEKGVQPVAGAVAARSNLPCDNVHLHPVADRVLKHYREVVNCSAVRKGQWAEAVIFRLNSGCSEADLFRAADAYAAFCREENKGKEFRVAASTFYGQGGAYEDFLDYQPKSETEEQRRDRIKRDQEKMRRETEGPRVQTVFGTNLKKGAS